MSIGSVNGFSPFAAGLIRPEGPQVGQQAGLQTGQQLGQQTGGIQTPFAPQVMPGIGEAKGPGFGERVAGAVDNLAQTQNTASQRARDFEMGLETDLASVMIDQQISSLGFQFALNVRNKALGAYRDIINMPV
jgi:flagellar hook-basal body complex protein FliE